MSGRLLLPSQSLTSGLLAFSPSSTSGTGRLNRVIVGPPFLAQRIQPLRSVLRLNSAGRFRC